MSRKATSWSYGPEVLGLKLTARDLAFLRAVCWSIHPKLRRTRPLTEKALARLTGIGSPTTQGAAFTHLNKLGLLARQHANELPRKDGEPSLTTTAYVYTIPVSGASDMSFCALKWSYMSPAVLNGGLTRSDLAVLRALCWFFQDRDRTPHDVNCYPSVDKLAAATGLEKSAVNAAKKRLLEKNLISWQRAANFNDDRLKSNNYTINCPELQDLLKRNEARLKGPRETPTDEEEEELRTPSLKPGLLYVRPRPESLAAAFPEPLSADETVWMADALEFIRDTPANRTSLFAALRKSGSLAACRAALDRVRQTSRNGRKIGNRVGYLLTALHTGETPHGKTDSA